MIKTVKEYFEKLAIAEEYLCDMERGKSDRECPELDEVRAWNKALCDKYPFIKYRNCDSPSNEIIDGYYDDTMLDCMPQGWYIAFALDMCEELAQALNRAGIPLDEYQVEQVKEKFGGLRWYDDNGCDETFDIIRKYEQISYDTCCVCGEPAVWETTGWICPYCDACAHKVFECKKRAYRLTDEVTFENCNYFRRIPNVNEE